jgi:hypothetical protein
MLKRVLSSVLVPLATLVAAALAPAPLAAQTQVFSRLAVDRCMDVNGGSRTAGTQLIIWSCNGGDNQKFAPQGNGEIRVYGSMCVDALGGSGRDGDKIAIWPCNGGANQRWSMGSGGEIRGINGKCIDVPGGNSAQGTGLVLWTCNGGLNQRWSQGGSGAPSGGRVSKLYVLDGTDSYEVHHNSMYHFYERWAGAKYWQNGVNRMATNIDGAYQQAYNVVCQDARSGGVTDVYLAGYSRGAIMAIRLANEVRRNCGAKVRFLGLVDAVNTSIWNWPTQVDPGVNVALHIRKPRGNEHVLTTADIGGVHVMTHPEDISHQGIVCNKDGNDTAWRWTLDRLVENAQRVGGTFNPSQRNRTDC